MAAETRPGAPTTSQPQQGYTLTLTEVPRANLVTLLADFLHRDPVWGLVEGLAAICWLRGQSSDGTAELYALSADQHTSPSTHLPAADLVANWSTGRVFDEGVEWRWRKEGNDVYSVLGLAETQAVLLLGMQTLTNTQDSTRLSAGWQVTAITQHLVGSIINESKSKLAEQTWHEVRNPHPLLYPVSHAGNRNRQPRLQTYTYATGEGTVRFTRFYALTALDITQGA